jgi:hypothetical protein
MTTTRPSRLAVQHPSRQEPQPMLVDRRTSTLSQYFGKVEGELELGPWVGRFQETMGDT